MITWHYLLEAFRRIRPRPIRRNGKNILGNSIRLVTSVLEKCRSYAEEVTMSGGHRMRWTMQLHRTTTAWTEYRPASSAGSHHRVGGNERLVCLPTVTSRYSVVRWRSDNEPPKLKSILYRRPLGCTECSCIWTTNRTNSNRGIVRHFWECSLLLLMYS